MYRVKFMSTYANIPDKGWYEILSKPASSNLAATNWFFETKCYFIIVYISETIMKERKPQNLYGMFYYFVSYNDWYVIRKYEGRNGATLETWLSRCAVNYFRKLKKKSDANQKRILSVSENPDYYLYNSAQEDLYASMTDECISNTIEGNSSPGRHKLYRAFSKLNERDQMVIKLLVIENNSVLDIAPTLFVYRKGGLPLEHMTTKQIQDTVSIMKRRACAKLLLEYKKIMSYE